MGYEAILPVKFTRKLEREKKIQKKKKKIIMLVNASKCAIGLVFFFFFAEKLICLFAEN